MTTNTIQLKHHSMRSMSSRGSYALDRKDNTITTIQWQRQQSRVETTTDVLVGWALENPWNIGIWSLTVRTIAI